MHLVIKYGITKKGFIMPKRYTDTDKWKKQWFRKLSPKMKLFWDYVTTSCDYCGIWDVDFEVAAFMVGQKYTQEEVMIAFEHKLMFIDEDKIFIPSFINFQYGEKPGASKMHQSIKRKLDSLGLEWGNKAIISTPTQEPIEEVVKVDTNKAQELLAKALESKELVQRVRNAYPLNNGGEPANKAVAKAIKDHGFDIVIEGSQRYAENVAGTEPRFIKSTTRFFSEEVFLDFQEDAPNNWDHDSTVYKLCSFFHEGVKNWTAGIKATEAEIQGGCIHFKEMLEREDVNEAMIVALVRWIDGHKDSKSGFSYRTLIRTPQNLKERFFRNEFHEFTKSYQGK